MVVCVYCGTPTRELLLSYGPDHVVCTRCVKCGQFADPYVEQEIVIVAIDLILVKPRAYRHLLFNRPQLEIPDWDSRAKGKGPIPREEEERKNAVRAPPSPFPSAKSWSSTWWTLARRMMSLFLVDSYLRWFYLCARNSEQIAAADNDFQLPSRSYQSIALHSFLRVFAATTLQQGTLFMTTLALSMLYHRVICRISRLSSKIPREAGNKTKAETPPFRSQLVLTSLLLANLTPVFLLSLLLLWHSSNTPSTSSSNGWQWDENSIDWAIRSLVGGLSSGVALGVVLPLQGSKVGAFIATSILLAAWTLQIQVSSWLRIPLHSGVGVLQTAEGATGADLYCR